MLLNGAKLEIKKAPFNLLRLWPFNANKSLTFIALIYSRASFLVDFLVCWLAH